MAPPPTSAQLADHLHHRWERNRYSEAKRGAIARRSQIVGTLTNAPTKHLRTAHAYTTLLEVGAWRFAADYLARPHLVESTVTPADSRTTEGFIDAARVFRGLDRPAALDLVNIAGDLAFACTLLAKVGTPQFAYEWDGTRWTRTTTHPDTHGATE